MGGPAPASARAGRLPVLLVHGYVCNRAAGWALARALRRRGETVWAPTLEPVYGAIDTWVEPLAAAVDRLRTATGAERVVLVTHSMGGLAARAYLRARNRPTGFVDTLQPLLRGRLESRFRAAGARVSRIESDGTRLPEAGSPMWPLVRFYYRLAGVSPQIELLAWK